MESRKNLFGLAILVVLCLCETASAEWSEPVPLDEVNTPYTDKEPFLSFDGLTLYFDRLDTDTFYYTRLYQATRAVPYGPFTSVEEISTLNYSEGHVTSAWVSPDNLRMYYVRTEPGSRWRLKMSVRASADDPWPPGANISELNTLGDLARPRLTPDELTIFFLGNGVPGNLSQYNIWTATRTDRNSPFGDIKNVTEINTTGGESPYFVTADGLTLYFGSSRNGEPQSFRASRDSVDSPFENIEHLGWFEAPGRTLNKLHLTPDGKTCYLSMSIDGQPQNVYVAYLEEDAGLVAHWKFDEGSGAIAYDSAGNNDGVVYGATWVDGVLDGALDFDGDMDYVEVPDDDSLNPSSAITISWWVLNRGGQNAGILKYASCPGESHSPGNSRAYALFLSDTDTQMTVFSAVGTFDIVESDNPLSFNEWHHVVGTFDRGDVAIYADGNLEVADTMTVSSIMNDDHPLIIGGCWSYCGADHFVSRLNGLADDVRIYDRALSAAEVEELYGAEPSGGLVAHWKFDEGEGTVAYDSAGDNDGTVYGATWVDGVLDGALDFDGVDDYVEAASSESLKLDAAGTVSAWVRPTSLYRQSLVNKKGVVGSGNNSENYWLTFGSYNQCTIVIGDGVSYANATIPEEDLAVNTWQHIVGTWDSSEISIYLNGNLIDVQPNNLSNLVRSDSYPLRIGHGSRADWPFDGLLDDVRIYDRALSAGEVEELYGEEFGSFLAKFVVVRKERVGRTVFEYDCDVVLQNFSDFVIENVSLEMAEWPGNMTIIKPNVSFGGAVIGPGESATSVDTCTFRVDRSEAIDPAEIIWHVTAELADSGVKMEHTLSSRLSLGPEPVGFDGLREIAAKWLWQGPAGGIEEDSARDGTVNLADFAKFAEQWKNE